MQILCSRIFLFLIVVVNFNVSWRLLFFFVLFVIVTVCVFICSLLASPSLPFYTIGTYCVHLPTVLSPQWKHTNYANCLFRYRFRFLFHFQLDHSVFDGILRICVCMRIKCFSLSHLICHRETILVNRSNVVIVIDTDETRRDTTSQCVICTERNGQWRKEICVHYRCFSPNGLIMISGV